MENIKLKDVLKSGDIVRTRKRGEKKWNTNIAFNVKNDELVLDAGINEEYYKSIKVGDKVECKVTLDKFEYTIEANVTDMASTPMQTMTLNIKEIKKYDNLRKESRHFVYLFALIRQNEEDRDPIFSVITDISKGGVAVLINDRNSMERENISVHDRVYFEVSLEDQRKIKFEGIIKREKKTKSSIEYGVQISDIDNDNRKVLDDYVDELKNTDDEFQQLKQEIWEYNFSV